MKDLEQLLYEAERLFRDSDWISPKLTCYDFLLAKFPYGWEFKVVNNWYKWRDEGLQYCFGAYYSPQNAVQAFLDYVKRNKVNVRALMDKEKSPGKKKRKPKKSLKE